MKLGFQAVFSSKGTQSIVALLAILLFCASVQAQATSKLSGCTELSTKVECSTALEESTSCDSSDCSGKIATTKVQGYHTHCTRYICMTDLLTREAYFVPDCKFGTRAVGYCESSIKKCGSGCLLPVAIESVAKLRTTQYNDCPLDDEKVYGALQAQLTEAADAEYLNMVNGWFADSAYRESAESCSVISEPDSQILENLMLE